MKTASFVLALAGAFLMTSTSASAAERTFKACKCSLDVPDGWKQADPDPNKPNKIKLRFDGGGTFIISCRDKKLPLDKVLEATIKTAKERGWKVVKRVAHRVASNDGIKLELDVPTKVKDVTTKQVIYFFNTDAGYRTLHFTARDSSFKGETYESITKTYKAAQ